MKTYNKLVRDRIPEIIKAEGASLKTRILDDVEFRIELMKKLVEEAHEVVGASADKKELIKEIGDVFEVIDAIITAFELDKADIQKVKEERQKSRGAFEEKIFLEYTD